MAEITWVKLTINMFDDEKIRLIEAMPEADAIIIIWVRLLTLAGKTNDDGRIYIDISIHALTRSATFGSLLSPFAVR